MLVLDTASVPAPDRAEAFQSTVSDNCSTSTATFDAPGELRAEVHLVELGPAKVLTIDASGTTLRRTPRMARAMNEASIALALPVRASNRMSWEREHRLFGPRDLILVDLSEPYVYSWPDGGASYAFHVDADELALPRDTVHRAARELRSSPLYGLVRDHITRVVTRASALAGTDAARDVGAASARLMRALVVSAAGDEARLGEALHASEGDRVRTWVREHLRDPDLGPERIAAAHAMSVRALYKLYASRGESLEQSIIDQRLAGARADLASPAHRHRSIADVGRRWGFGNPSHFARRFRAAHGVTPRQWRATAAPGPEERAR